MAIEVKAIYISGGHDFYGRHGKGRLENGIKSVQTVECIAGMGLAGDRFFGYKENFKGQITFFSDAVFEEIKRDFNLPDLESWVFRRNVLISGFDINEWIGKRFSLQGIEFEGSEEASPCYWMNEAVAEGVEQTLKGNGGVRARILNDGVLSTGAAE